MAVSSGAIHMKAGWEVLNLTLVPPVVFAMAVVGWHFLAKRTARTVVAWARCSGGTSVSSPILPRPTVPMVG
jgi:hypothetical protein